MEVQIILSLNDKDRMFLTVQGEKKDVEKFMSDVEKEYLVEEINVRPSLKREEMI